MQAKAGILICVSPISTAFIIRSPRSVLKRRAFRVDSISAVLNEGYDSGGAIILPNASEDTVNGNPYHKIISWSCADAFTRQTSIALHGRVELKTVRSDMGVQAAGNDRELTNSWK